MDGLDPTVKVKNHWTDPIGKMKGKWILGWEALVDSNSFLL